MKDVLIKNCYTSAFDIKDENLKKLIIINTKCLTDDKVQRNVYTDTNRLRDELVYFNFYGDRPQYTDILNLLLPSILSNTNVQRGEEEVISLISKYIKYLKFEEYRFEYILAAVLYNSLIHQLMENVNIEYGDLLQAIKERMIGFKMELDKSDIIKFQMQRIKAIQTIDNYIDLKVCDYKENEIIVNFLNVIYDVYIDDRQVLNDGILSLKKSILSILGIEPNLNIGNIDFISSMSLYITKLRKYSINKSPYKISSNPRNFINLKKGDTIVDPILNRIKVIDKELQDNILRISVEAKSGTYTFKFKRV